MNDNNARVWCVMDGDCEGSWVVATYNNKDAADTHAALNKLQVENHAVFNNHAEYEDAEVAAAKERRAEAKRAVVLERERLGIKR